MTDHPVVLYDTTLRDGTQGENITLSLADKLRIARMLDEYGMPYIEGGWPGSNPKDIEFFAAARKHDLADGEARRVRLDPPPGQPPRGRPEPPRAGRGRDARRDDLRQELAAPRDRGPGRHAGREPGHDRGVGRVRRRPRPRGGLRRGALLRRLQGRPRLRAVDAARRAPGRRPDARPVRHQRRHAHRRAGRDPRATPAARSRRDPDAPAGHLGHPHPQRRRARGRQLDRGGPGRACATSRRRSTATASAAATPTWSAILANLALKTELRADARGGGELDRADRALARPWRRSPTRRPNDYQPYVGRSAFAHKGGVHGAAVAKVERSYQHVDPTRRRQRGPARRVSELGGKANTASAPSSWATSSRAWWTRRCSRS